MPRAIRKTAAVEQTLEMVSEGERVTITKVDDRGNMAKRTPLSFVVAAKCGHSVNAGQWVCATHEMTFTNQFCKDSHIHEGAHRLGWFCFECNNVQVP